MRDHKVGKSPKKVIDVVRQLKYILITYVFCAFLILPFTQYLSAIPVSGTLSLINYSTVVAFHKEVFNYNRNVRYRCHC